MALEIRIQVVAFPGRPYRRLKLQLESLQQKGMPEDTFVRFVQSRHDILPELRQEELNQIAVNVQEGYAHIAVLPTRDYNALNQFDLDCRVVRLRVDGDLMRLSYESFHAALITAVEYEKRWCSVVRPNNWHSPLWLPPPSFEVKEDLRNYWRRCDCYQRTELIGQAHDLIKSVKARHRRSEPGQGQVWVDVRSRRFRVDRSLHGMTKEGRYGQRQFRFAAEVPAGFHYDVTHTTGRTFSVTSATATHENCVRANINPWGHCVVKT